MRQEPEKKRGEIERIISFEFGRHFDLKGFDKVESNATEKNIEAEFYHPGNNETKNYFYHNGIVLEMIDSPISLGSYCLDVNGKPRNMHTSDYYNIIPGDAQVISDIHFKKIIEFIKQGFVNIPPQEGVDIDEAAVHIQTTGWKISLPFDWNTFSDEELLKYESRQPWYKPEESLFTDLMGYISRNGFEELPKHQYEVFVAERKHEFDKINRLRNWSA